MLPASLLYFTESFCCFASSVKASLLQEYDGILVLKDGRLAETGTFEELVRRGGYFNALYTLAH